MIIIFKLFKIIKVWTFFIKYFIQLILLYTVLLFQLSLQRLVRGKKKLIVIITVETKDMDMEIVTTLYQMIDLIFLLEDSHVNVNGADDGYRSANIFFFIIKRTGEEKF